MGNRVNEESWERTWCEKSDGGARVRIPNCPTHNLFSAIQHGKPSRYRGSTVARRECSTSSAHKLQCTRIHQCPGNGRSTNNKLGTAMIAPVDEAYGRHNNDFNVPVCTRDLGVWMAHHLVSQNVMFEVRG